MPLRRWHRRIGLLVGIPCLLWGLSGAVLAWKHLAALSPPGDPTRVAGAHTPFSVPVDQAVRAAGRSGPPMEVRWRWLLSRPRYEIRYFTPPQVVVIDGLTGKAAPPLDCALARQVAEADGGVPARDCTLITAHTLIYRPDREVPAFRVALDNGHDVYVSPTTGQLLAHVDLLYRLFRVAFFGLHMWDLSVAPGRHLSFGLLLAMALLLLAMGVTGLYLALATRARPGGRLVGSPAPE
jgi:hypothetical protein